MKQAICCVLAFWALMHLPSDTVARPVQNVGLLSFLADSQSGGVFLNWQTATELDSAGFYLDRSALGETAVRLTTAPIPATGNPTVGASYTFLDKTAVVDTAYIYRLVEVGIDGSEVVLDDVAITFENNPEPIGMAPPLLPTATQPQNSTPDEQDAEPVTLAVPAPQRPDRAVLSIVTNATEQDHTAAENPTTVNIEYASDVPQTPLQQETPANGYPDPPTPTVQGDAYVPQPTTTPLIPTQTAEGTPYVPPPTQTPIGAGPTNGSTLETAEPLSTLGGDSLDASDFEDEQRSETALPPLQNRVFLWLGFLGALIIFGAAVLITTLTFSRRTQ